MKFQLCEICEKIKKEPGGERHGEPHGSERTKKSLSYDKQSTSCWGREGSGDLLQIDHMVVQGEEVPSESA